MPYEPYTGDPTDNRYDLIRTPDTDNLQLYWTMYVVFLLICVLTNAGMVNLILTTKKLRDNSFNLFILGLCIPDGLFSWLCAIQCSLNLSAQEWFGGKSGQSVMCDYQGFYITFCLFASCWTNFIIAFNMRKMTKATINVQKYSPPSKQYVKKKLAQIAGGGLLMAFCTQLGWITNGIIPLRNGNYHGMFCVPQEYNVASTVILWIFYLDIVIFGPMVGISYCYMWCFHHLAIVQMKKNKKSYWTNQRALMSSFRMAKLNAGETTHHNRATAAGPNASVLHSSGNLKASVMGRLRGSKMRASVQPTNGNDHHAHPGAQQRKAAAQSKDKVASMARTFAKFYLVYVALWGPALVCLWLIGVYPVLVFIGGLSGHLHGLVSPIVYLTKPDIKRAFVARYGRHFRKVGVALHVPVSIGSTMMSRGSVLSRGSKLGGHSGASMGSTMKTNDPIQTINANNRASVNRVVPRQSKLATSG